MLDPVTTFCAPAGRDTPGELTRKVTVWQGQPAVRQVLDAMPSPVFVLNERRQIVSINTAGRAFLNTADEQAVVGRRPGEAVRCIWASEGPDGCGTGRHCAVCGALQGILEVQQTGKPVTRECRISVATPSGVAPLELRITATRMTLAEMLFYLIGVEDVSQRNRLAALQRLFLHDIANATGCIHGLARILRKSESPEPGLLDELDATALQLLDDVRAYRELAHAEAGDLGVFPAPVSTEEVLQELRTLWMRHEVAQDRRIVITEVWAGTVRTDRQLLRRVLGNMIKNALEASPPGESVTLSCRELDSTVSFSVHNAGVMPPDVQMQVFQRSFSTKGERGRGLGTHSMKLLGERYMRGTVSFTSAEPDGTTFTLALPNRGAGSRE